MTQFININPQRIEYMMELFRFSKEDILKEINKGLKIPIKEKDIFNDHIKLKYLKKIDKIFDQGLFFYTDPKKIKIKKSTSILLRKNNSKHGLKLLDKIIVNKMESRISNLSALCKLSNYKIKKKIKKKKLPIFDIQTSPDVAYGEMKNLLYPKKKTIEEKKFLEFLIKTFSDRYGILVLEFPERYMIKGEYTPNMAGCFIKPNNIIIRKRSFLIEEQIHTLIYLFAYYLLQEEYIDNGYDNYNYSNKINAWCRNFATKFIIEFREYGTDKRLYNIGDQVSKIIYSPLEKDIYIHAYYRGVISEYELLSHFKEKNIDKFISNHNSNN